MKLFKTLIIIFLLLSASFGARRVYVNTTEKGTNTLLSMERSIQILECTYDYSVHGWTNSAITIGNLQSAFAVFLEDQNTNKYAPLYVSSTLLGSAITNAVVAINGVPVCSNFLPTWASDTFHRYGSNMTEFTNFTHTATNGSPITVTFSSGGAITNGKFTLFIPYITYKR